MKWLFVIATGFEPVTVCLEGRCSIQLSYATLQGLTALILKIFLDYVAKLRDPYLALPNEVYPNFLKKASFLLKLFSTSLSGWQDSNLRPPRPKRGAITGLRYTPKLVINLFMRRDRDSNPGNTYALTD